jgi:hypothetical protein
MKTAIVMQIVQLGQYGEKSANTDFFLVLTDFDPVNIGFPDGFSLDFTYVSTIK